MQANKKKGPIRLLTFAGLLAILTAVGFWFSGGRSSDWFNVSKIDPKTQALELIRTRYVDPINMDSLKKWPLDSLLLRLDPHSAYLDPASLRLANEQLAGHFAGIGIEFSRIRDTVTVAYLMPGSPSLKAGLKTGDQLIAIDRHPLTGPNLKLDSIQFLVRGPVGTSANLTVRSKGQLKKISIVRSEIITPAVVTSYMLNDTIGFIKLARFSDKSYRETMMALEALNEKGMRALILDLRGNGGGFLHEAVELADEFLSEDRLIVYTEGAHQPKRSYTCKRPGLFETGKLTVLMDEFSASASEVLAGALQDWCRATILGHRSYGKGLVQEQYELSNQGALRLTVARYYTPLGRCIQRPFLGDRSAYLHEVLEKKNRSTNIQPLAGRIFVNTCGDSLYADGGIYPDVYMEEPAAAYSLNGRKVLANPETIQWAYLFYAENQSRLDGIRDLDRMTSSSISVEEVQRFFRKERLLDAAMLDSLTLADWLAISEEFHAQVLRFRSGTTGYFRFKHARDPYVLAALAGMKE